jgi:lycopene cyclase domain-containing protein
MSVYLLVDLLTIAGPLALSFDRRVAFWRRWGALFPAILVSGGLHAAWDALVTARGDWSFNPAYVLPLRIAGLPLEEILFFVAVPYACVFIYEVVRAYLTEREVRVTRAVSLPLAAAAAVTAVAFRGQHYTLIVCLALALFFALCSLPGVRLLRSRSFWIAQAISYVPFLAVNGVLTALPVVRYDDSATWGVRVYSIPVEDFLYSFTLLGLSLLVYTVIAGLRERACGAARPPRGHDRG